MTINYFKFYIPLIQCVQNFGSRPFTNNRALPKISNVTLKPAFFKTGECFFKKLPTKSCPFVSVSKTFCK